MFRTAIISLAVLAIAAFAEPGPSQGKSQIWVFNTSSSFRYRLPAAYNFALKNRDPKAEQTLLRFQRSARIFGKGQFSSRRQFAVTLQNGLQKIDPQPGTIFSRALRLTTKSLPESGPVEIVFLTDGFSEMQTSDETKQMAPDLAILRRNASRLTLKIVGVDSRNFESLQDLFQRCGIKPQIISVDQL